MDPVPDCILVFLGIPEMLIAETPFRSEIILKTVYIGIRRNTAHIRQGRLTPVIGITGIEIPFHMFQIHTCFTEDLIPAGNKLTDMGTAGQIMILTAYITVSFKPDFIFIGFQQ